MGTGLEEEFKEGVTKVISETSPNLRGLGYAQQKNTNNKKINADSEPIVLNLDLIPTEIIYERLIGSESRNSPYNFFRSEDDSLRITYQKKVPNESSSSNDNSKLKREEAKYSLVLNLEKLKATTKHSPDILSSNNIKEAFLECDQDGQITSIQLKLTDNSLINLSNKNSEPNNVFNLSSNRNTAIPLDKNNLNQITNFLIKHTNDIITEHLSKYPTSVNLKLKDFRDLKREQETVERLSNPDLATYSKNIAEYLLKITSRSDETKERSDHQELNIDLPLSETKYQIRTSLLINKTDTLTTSFQINNTNTKIKYDYDGMNWRKFEGDNNSNKENKTLSTSEILDELKNHLLGFANYIYRY